MARADTDIRRGFKQQPVWYELYQRYGTLLDSPEGQILVLRDMLGYNPREEFPYGKEVFRDIRYSLVDGKFNTAIGVLERNGKNVEDLLKQYDSLEGRLSELRQSVFKTAEEENLAKRTSMKSPSKRPNSARVNKGGVKILHR